jgi:hypothetical protein
VVTLVLQAPLLPIVVRWARLPEDTSVEKERPLAETLATQAGLANIPPLAAELGTSQHVADELTREYERHLRVLQAQGDVDDEAAIRHHDDYTTLRRAVIARKRATVLQSRDKGDIDDTVLRQIQARLGLEDLRFTDHDLVE